MLPVICPADWSAVSTAVISQRRKEIRQIREEKFAATFHQQSNYKGHVTSLYYFTEVQLQAKY